MIPYRKEERVKSLSLTIRICPPYHIRCQKQQVQIKGGQNKIKPAAPSLARKSSSPYSVSQYVMLTLKRFVKIPTRHGCWVMTVFVTRLSYWPAGEPHQSQKAGRGRNWKIIEFDPILHAALQVAAVMKQGRVVGLVRPLFIHSTFDIRHSSFSFPFQYLLNIARIYFSLQTTKDLTPFNP